MRVVSGSVWLCPELIYCHTLEVAKDHPRSSLEEAAGSSDCGSGRRELWPSPLACAEHPAKPGLTPAWGEHGEDGSAPATSSQCHVTSLLTMAALGWPKLGPLWGIAWPQTGWGLGATCSACTTPGSPRVALKMSLYLLCGQRYCCPYARPCNTATATSASEPPQHPHGSAFNANGRWLATRQLLSQVWNLLIPPSGLKLQGEGKMFHHFSLNPISEIFNNSSFAKYGLWNGFDFSLGKQKQKKPLLKSKLCCQNRPF